jgi:hypothetical protein
MTMARKIVRIWTLFIILAAGLALATLSLWEGRREDLSRVPFEAGATPQNPLSPAVVGLLFGCSSAWSKGIRSSDGAVNCWDMSRNGIVPAEVQSAGLR